MTGIDRTPQAAARPDLQVLTQPKRRLVQVLVTTVCVLASLTVAPTEVKALTNSNVIVVGSSECDGNVRRGHLASRLELAGFVPSILCISSSGPSFGIDVARMDPVAASTVVLTAGLNVRPAPIFGEPAQSDLFVPQTDSDGYITPAGFRQAVRTTVDELRLLGVERIIWFPVADSGHGWHSHYVTNNAILRQEAALLDFEVVPWDLMVDADWFGSDGVHYTDEGYTHFVDAITEAVGDAVAPPSVQLGPCSYLARGVPAATGATILGITEQEFLDANPHWNPFWLYGGIVCRSAAEVPHPDANGTPISEDSERILTYSPYTGVLAEFFAGTPEAGGPASIIGPVSSHVTDVLGADIVSRVTLEGDSTPHLLLYDRPTGWFDYLSADGAGNWSTVSHIRGSTGWSSIVPGDFNGDGTTDLLFYRATDGLMRFYTMGPQGIGAPLTPAMHGTRGWTHIVAGDFDGEGSEDVYWYRASDGLMRFYEVRSAGRMVPTSPAMVGTRNWTHIPAGRFGENTGLIFYRDDGLARFYGVGTQWRFSALSPVLNLDPGFRDVVTGNLDGAGTDEVFWYRSAGSMVTTLSDGQHQPVTGSTPMPQGLLMVDP